MKQIACLRRTAMLALFATAGCGDGGSTGPAAPASLVAMTAVAQTAAVASPVPVPPAVRVSDNRGRGLVGVQVTFAVTGGEGTVAASSLTDAGGVAVAANWVMGVLAQENTLTASVPGLQPVVFRATAAPGLPAALQKTGGDGQSAAVATPLADSIAIRVVDQYGNGVPGMLVNFTASGGLLTATRVTTGAQGHARVMLVMPNQPGTLQVLAGMGALEPQSFSVTAVPGPPAALTRVAGDAQSAYSGFAVSVAPSVRVADSFGNPIPGRTVMFTPAAGSGVVTGGTAVTGADGRARVGSWVLGEMGRNRLIATTAGLDSVEFTATALEPCGRRTYTLFTTLSDTLRPDRCVVAGRNAEVYSFAVPSEQCLEFRMNAEYDTYLFVLNSGGTVLAHDDDSGGGLNSLIHIRLSAGTYLLGAAAYGSGLGQFQLTSSASQSTQCGAAPSSQRGAPKQAP
ncbi:MAG TPA: Ig-like domain-containing protein [Longimicrobium sp.]|jgi:hypothetical protein|uniref:Ig-like domain-containing protein n=1 Tax=Longimicrobium sp. TaxID=2029185 RepID=UPI002EDB7608